MSVVSGVITFASGIASAYLTEVLWEQRRRLRRAFDRWRTARPDVLGFDPLSAGLYPINRWSPARPLVRRRLRMHVLADRPSSPWIEEAEWRTRLSEPRRSHSGRTAYLTGFSIDHRESEHGEYFHYWVTPCDYSEYLASRRYLADHPEVREKIRSMLQKGQVPGHVLAIEKEGVGDHRSHLAVLRQNPDRRAVEPYRLPAVHRMWLEGGEDDGAGHPCHVQALVVLRPHEAVPALEDERLLQVPPALKGKTVHAEPRVLHVLHP